MGSLTRTVEYLQLTVEHEESDRYPLCQPFRSVGFAEDWTELEERRRVFWNVFNLDRFCSVTMGWNTSLTSDDVQRRLPCEGLLWRRQDPVLTPYFGIWDKSAGRIGNPIAFMPGDHHSPEQQMASESDTQNQTDASPSPTAAGATPGGMSTVGAYAYAIEATESMSRITSYFLQQKVNMSDQREISAWLTRFKELDLRLVHWKMLLPHKWKTNIARETTKMDPNLTMAHITHNASMILLHQLIAYPPLNWGFRNRLPSTCSAETCYSAGVEIATIVKNYLKVTPSDVPVSPQYAFCMFIAARIFLIHWRYYSETQPGDEFWLLVQSLDEISHRWNGSSSSEQLDLAAKYASKLRELHEACSKSEAHRINVAGYTTEIQHRVSVARDFPVQGQPTSPSAATHVPQESPRPWSQYQQQPDVNQWMAYASSPRTPLNTGYVNNGGATGATPGTSSLHHHHHHHQMRPPNIEIPTDPTNVAPSLLTPGMGPGDVSSATATEFSALPQIFMDQSFINQDRVISFDGGNLFSGDLEGQVW